MTMELDTQKIVEKVGHWCYLKRLLQKLMKIFIIQETKQEVMVEISEGSAKILSENRVFYNPGKIVFCFEKLK